MYELNSKCICTNSWQLWTLLYFFEPIPHSSLNYNSSFDIWFIFDLITKLSTNLWFFELILNYPWTFSWSVLEPTCNSSLNQLILWNTLRLFVHVSNAKNSRSYGFVWVKFLCLKNIIFHLSIADKAESRSTWPTTEKRGPTLAQLLLSTMETSCLANTVKRAWEITSKLVFYGWETSNL